MKKQHEESSSVVPSLEQPTRPGPAHTPAAAAAAAASSGSSGSVSTTQQQPALLRRPRPMLGEQAHGESARTASSGPRRAAIKSRKIRKDVQEYIQKCAQNNATQAKQILDVVIHSKRDLTFCCFFFLN